MNFIQVQQVFRKPIPEYFSLENVFSIIREPLSLLVSVSKHAAVTSRANPLAVFRNLLFFRKLRGDVIHVTGDIHYAVFAFPGRKTVLTIHDCVFLYHQKGLRKWIFLWFWLKLPVRHARFITTISEATKKDIIQYTGCEPSRITVINNPMDPAYTHAPKSFHATKPIILQMGTWSNKNLNRVAEAIQGINCHLSVIGKLSDEQLALMKQLNIEFSNHFNLSKDDLIRQYKACDLVVFVSTFEGFGLPVIEAQAIGRPLVTSDIAPMNEVAGAGACLANPYDVASIRKCINDIIRDEVYRDRIVQNGLLNVKRFRPETIAADYAKVYALAAGVTGTAKAESSPELQ